MTQTDIEDIANLGPTPQPGAQGLTVTAEDLLAAITVVAGVIDRTNVIPILACLKMTSDGRCLTISGTNPERVAEISVTATTRGTWTAVAPATLVLDLIKRLPKDAAVTVDIEPEAIRIKGGTARARIPTLDPNDYPAFAAEALPYSFTIGGATLLEMIDRVTFMADITNARESTRGILLRHAGDKLRLVACRAAGIAMAEHAMAGDGADVILPLMTIASLRTILGDADVVVVVDASESLARFITGGTGGITLTSKLHSGPYAFYERYLSVDAPHTLRLSAKPFLAALGLAAAFSETRLRPVRFAVNGGGLAISSLETEVDAEASLSVGDMEYDGPDIAFGMQSALLAGVARAAKGDVLLSMKDAMSPMMARDSTDDSVCWVMQPYKV